MRSSLTASGTCSSWPTPWGTGREARRLARIAIVSTSLYGLLSLLFNTDPETLKASFGPRTPTRLVSGFLVGYSLLFALMWVGLSLASAVAGTRPDEVTHSVVAIDCTVLLPLLFFGGLLLWRRGAWGYVLGGFLLLKMAATGFTLAFTTALGVWWVRGIDPFNAFLFVLFALMAIGSVALLVPFGEQEETLSADFDPQSGLMSSISGMRYRNHEKTKTSWRGEFSEWRTLHGIKVPHRNVAIWEDQREPYGFFEIEGAEYNVDVSEKISSKQPGAYSTSPTH